MPDSTGERRRELNPAREESRPVSIATGAPANAGRVRGGLEIVNYDGQQRAGRARPDGHVRRRGQRDLQLARGSLHVPAGASPASSRPLTINRQPLAYDARGKLVSRRGCSLQWGAHSKPVEIDGNDGRQATHRLSRLALEALAVAEIGGSMIDAPNARHLAKRLCEDAIVGKLQLNEFYARWPNVATGDALLDAVFSDMEDAIEHFPARLISGTTDTAAWERSQWRHRLVVDALLLGSDADGARLLDVRRALLSLSPASQDQLEREFARLLTAP